jgi:phosphoribosyl 1,2-cyclic phosphodiesterase
LVLDAGTGMRALGGALVERDAHQRVHLLLSHTHWDHILGLPFFGPLWHLGNEVLVYPLPTDEQERFQRTIFDDIHFPVSANDIPAKVEFVKPRTEPWRIGSATVKRISLNHPGSAQGFRIEDEGGGSMVYLTDNELLRGDHQGPAMEKLARFSEGADLLIHDSQYIDSDMPEKHGWGHSVVDDVLWLGVQSEAKTLALFHHDPNRSDDELDAIGARSQVWLAEHFPGGNLIVAREGLEIELGRK